MRNISQDPARLLLYPLANDFLVENSASAFRAATKLRQLTVALSDYLNYGHSRGKNCGIRLTTNECLGLGQVISILI